MTIEETEIDAEEIFQLTRSIQQEEDLHIRIIEECASEDAIVIQGFPDLSFTGHLCCRYLMRTNKVKRVAGVHSKFFTPMLQMFDGEIIYPITLFKMLDLEATIDNKKRAIYILVSDTPIPEILIFKLMTRLFDFYKKLKIKRIITLESLVNSEKYALNHIPRVYELNSPERETIFGAERVSNTFLTGTAATCLILTNSTHQFLSNTLLLAESPPYNPRPETILKILKSLKKIIPELEINSKFIIEIVERFVTNTGTPFSQIPDPRDNTKLSRERKSDLQSYG